MALLSLAYVFAHDEHTWGATMTKFHLTCCAILGNLNLPIRNRDVAQVSRHDRKLEQLTKDQLSAVGMLGLVLIENHCQRITS